MTNSLFSTDDLYLAAYLLYCGCTLQGVSLINNTWSNYVFTARNIHKYVCEYNAYKPIKFAPRALADARQNLKQRCKHLTAND